MKVAERNEICFFKKKSVHLMDSWIVHKNNYAKKKDHSRDLKSELKSWKLSIYTLVFLISSFTNFLKSKLRQQLLKNLLITAVSSDRKSVWLNKQSHRKNTKLQALQSKLKQGFTKLQNVQLWRSKTKGQRLTKCIFPHTEESVRWCWEEWYKDWHLF